MPVRTPLWLLVAPLALASCGEDEAPGCPLGSAGCACTSGGGCDPGLACSDDVCQPDDTCSGQGCASGCSGDSHDCNLDPSDGCETDGPCEPELLIAEAGLWPRSLATDGSDLFWASYDTDDGAIRRAPLGGGTVMTVAASQLLAYNLALGGTDVFWVNYHSDGAVSRVPKTGGVVQTIEEQYMPCDVAVDATHVYWVTCEDGGVVARDRLDGGDRVYLQRTQPRARALALYGGDLYWVTAGYAEDDGAVLVLRSGGATPVTLAGGQQTPNQLTVTAAGVFWINRGPNDPALGRVHASIATLPLAGGTPLVLAAEQRDPAGIAADDTHVYWSTGAAGEVLRVPIAGGSVETLVADMSYPEDLLVHNGVLYWVDSSDGTIGRIVL